MPYIKAKMENRASEDTAPAAHAVRSLLARHGVAKHRQVAVVGELFQLSRAAAHRRTHGSAAWTVEELQVIAEKFGETLPDMLGGGAARGSIAATLAIGTVRAPCRIWLDEGDGSDSGIRVFVAIEDPEGSYTVVPADPPDRRPSLRIARIEVDQTQDHSARIAVLAAGLDAARAFCEALRQEGYQASPYSSIKTLAEDVARLPFDGYVLDWGLRGASVLSLVSKIRATDRRCAIAVLGPRSSSRERTTRDIAQASVTHDFHVFENPPRIEYVVAAFARSGIAPAKHRASA
jgi:hypothetical protein